MADVNIAYQNKIGLVDALHSSFHESVVTANDASPCTPPAPEAIRESIAKPEVAPPVVHVEAAAPAAPFVSPGSPTKSEAEVKPEIGIIPLSSSPVPNASTDDAVYPMETQSGLQIESLSPSSSPVPEEIPQNTAKPATMEGSIGCLLYTSPSPRD